MRAAVINWKPAMPLAIFGLMWLAVTLILSIETQPVLAFAVPYAILFWYMAWKYPTVALMLIFSIAPFQNDLGRGGARFSLTEVHIALLLPIVLIHCYVNRRQFRIGPILIPVLLYFAVCIYASIHFWLGTSTILSIAQMAIYLLVVVGIFASYPTSAEQFRPALYGLLVICSGIALYSLVTRNNFFWGLGKNGVGQALACAVIVNAELWFAAKNPLHKKVLIGTLALLSAGLVFSVSRGAWAGCLAGLLLICILRRQFALMFRVALVMIPLIAIAWQFLDPQTKDYATSFDKSRFNIAERYKFIDIAQDLWHDSPIFGSGVGIRKQYDATNLVWSALAETGVLGLAAFLLIHVFFFNMVLRNYSYLKRDSIEYSVMLIGSALLLRHFTHGMVDHYWSRGAVTMAWAGVGMATFSYALIQREHRRQAAIAHELAKQHSLAIHPRLRNLHESEIAHRPGVPRLPSPGRGRTHPV